MEDLIISWTTLWKNYAFIVEGCEQKQKLILVGLFKFHAKMEKKFKINR